MRKQPALFLAAILFVAEWIVVPSVHPAEDVVGLYVEPEAIHNIVHSVEGEYRLYLVLTDCSSPAGVHGWECKVVIPWAIFYTGVDYAGDAINIAVSPEFAVGVGQPLPWSPAILLASLDFYIVPGPPNHYLRLEAISTSSIPQQLVYADGANIGLLKIMYPASGSQTEPVFCFSYSDTDTVAPYFDFQAVTSWPLGDVGPSRGVSLIDFDNDEDLDVYIVNHNQANRLLRNDGDDVFVDVASGPMADAGAGQTAAWADYDNDDDLDLYLARQGQANLLLRNEGSAIFTDVTTWPLSDAGIGFGVSWADYNQDGLVDLYLVNRGGVNRLFKNLGDPGYGQWIFLEEGGVLSDPGDGASAAWADYDTDGDLDVYITNYNGTNRLFQNHGSQGFVDVTGTGPLAGNGNCAGAAWGDYNNDSHLDLYITNDGQADLLLQNQGSGAFTEITGFDLGDSGYGRGVVWGDFDNDGDLDLCVARHYQADLLLMNEGRDRFRQHAALGDDAYLNSNAAACGDIDGDGNLDVYISNANGPNVLWKNVSNTHNHWLELKLVGVTSNRSAIGSRIYVASSGLSQVREITCGSSYLAQNSLIAHFGLGAADIADFVIISWPSGRVTAHTNLPADALYVIQEEEPINSYLQGFSAIAANGGIELHWSLSRAEEGVEFDIQRAEIPGCSYQPITDPAVHYEGKEYVYRDQQVESGRQYTYRVDTIRNGLRIELFESKPVSLPDVQLTLHQNRPNPFNPVTSIAFTVDRLRTVRVAIYDLTGHRITVLTDEPYTAGSYEIVWNGTDFRGRAVASGTYIVRLEAEAIVHSRKIVLVR